MLDGQYFHEGYVTRDLARAAETLTQLYGMKFDWLDVPGTEAAEIKIRLAVGWHGNLEYELIEPVSGDLDFYRDMLADDHVPRLHHTGVRVADWRRLEDDIAAKGLDVVASGDRGEIRFAYVDMRDTLGHYVEYMWMSDDYWAKRQRGEAMRLHRVEAAGNR
jgi:hypothetical protein